MNLQVHCTTFFNARGTDRYDEVCRELRPLLRAEFAVATNDAWAWLAEALTDEERKWFVVFVLQVHGSVPNVLYRPMIRAAVYEINPSINRSFVEPCVRTFGHRKVITSLLDCVENGSDFEKAGAVNALYWTQIPFRLNQPTNTFEPIDESLYRELNDLRERRRRLLLQTFVRNPSVDVRRSIIPSLHLDPSVYPIELRPLIDEAINIARNHPDEYIRHRLQVQLGTERLFSPLPHRDKPV